MRKLAGALTFLCAASLQAAPGATAPARILSCTVASDEMLTDLLTRAGRMGGLVGVSTLADDPRYSNVKPPAGLAGRCGGELESMLKLKPDLAVVAPYNRPEIARRLADAGVRVHELPAFSSLDDIERGIAELGAAIGERPAADKVVAEFVAERRRLTAPATAAPVAPVRVLEFFPDGVVSGRETVFDDLVRSAGGLNVGGESGLKGWPKLQTEALAALRPDVIVATGDPNDMRARDALLARLRSLTGYRDMPAVRSGRLILVPQSELAAASPHILKALARIRAGLTAARQSVP